MTTLHVIHWLTLCLYVYALIKAIFIGGFLRHSTKLTKIKTYIRVVLICVIIQTSSFLFLQIDWIISGYSEDIDYNSALLWTIYDIANGLVAICYLTILDVYVRWREQLCPLSDEYIIIKCAKEHCDKCVVCDKFK